MKFCVTRRFYAGKPFFMRRARWLAEWRKAAGKPVLYHVHSRVVDRRFVFGDEEREKFRIFMRMQENFTGCRVLTYCVMSNHFHLLLEVPPVPEGGVSDELLLKRLAALYSEAFVDGVAQELENARKEEDEEMDNEHNDNDNDENTTIKRK